MRRAGHMLRTNFLCTQRSTPPKSNRLAACRSVRNHHYATRCTATLQIWNGSKALPVCTSCIRITAAQSLHVQRGVEKQSKITQQYVNQKYKRRGLRQEASKPVREVSPQKIAFPGAGSVQRLRSG